MDKPISLLIKESKDSLKKTLNEMPLPLSIRTMILKEALHEFEVVSDALLREETRQYEEGLAKEMAEAEEKASKVSKNS